jgi:CSLREA domain-containing protein
VLIYSTYFGGTGIDTATAITVNSAGEAFIAGTTASANFPGTALQGASTSNGDAFVAKLNAAGTAIVFASYFGGDNPDLANAITLDQSGNIYVAGSTQSFNFPTAGTPFQAAKQGGPQMKKSTDGGSNYSTITTGLSSANINGVAISPTDPSTVFVTSFGGEGLYKTTDGGAHWASARGNIPDAANNAVAIDPTNPANVYVAACNPGGVYRSHDGGATWSATSVSGTCMNTVITDASGAIYAGGFDGQGLHKSTDNGVTWTTIPIGTAFESIDGLAVAPGSPGTIYAGSSNGVYKSTDFGQTWTITALNTGSNFDDSIAVDPANSQIVFSAVDFHLQKTIDGGATWTPVNNLGIAANGFPTAIMIAPTLPAPTVYVGTTTNGILQSTDNGATWSPANLSTDDISMMAYAPSSVSTIYVGNLSGADSFVTKLDPSGSSLVYSTYLGGGTASDRGDKDDGINAIVVDPAGNAFVGGVADTVDFPAVNSLAPFGGQADAFVAKLDASGANVLFSTFLGGPAIDICNSVALSPSGGLYITGQTQSAFPTVNPSQPGSGGMRDVFVARLNPAGNSFTLGYSTYLGGANNDIAFGIALDASGNAYVTGQTASVNFPVLNAMQPTRAGGTEAFLTKLDPSGARVYSTYLGGGGTDIARGVAVDAAGNAYVAGLTQSANFPLTNAVQSFGGGFDAFITKINSVGSGRVYSTYLGGAGTDQAMGLALDSNNAVYLTGTTSSTEIKPGAIQGSNGGSSDAFVTKLGATSGSNTTDLSVSLIDNIDPIAVNANLTYTASVVNNGESDATGVTVTNTLPSNVTFVSASAGCSGTTTVTCNLAGLTSGQSKSVTIVVKPTVEGLITATSSATATETESNTANNTATRDTRVTIGTVYTVNSSADTDDGSCAAVGAGNGCTLREAMNAANVNASKDTILFNIGSGGLTITPASSLPGINNPVYIDGTSQPGFAGQPIIEISGASAGTCLYIPVNGSGSTIRGLAINRCNGHGISIDGSNNVIQGNYIGTNLAGTASAPVLYSSIFVAGSNNQIGGTSPSSRNVLSGNGHQGIAMTGSGNTIQGNYVGTNASGTAAIGGGAIFVFQGASNNMIGGSAGTSAGGSCTGACNLVSGNNGTVSINTFSGNGATNNTVQGNFIGLNVSGTATIPNSGGGVTLSGVSGNHVIGNVISGNSGTGLSLYDGGSPTPIGPANNDVRGNFIGTNPTGTAAFGNTGSGIDLHGGAHNNTIGGTSLADRNVIAGNAGAGININNFNGAASNNVVYGNYIGTNTAGNARLQNNGDGISIIGVSGNQIGGTVAGQGNLISGNNNRGITLGTGSPGGGQPGVAADGNFVQGNLIGTNAAGTAIVKNTLAGISLNGANNNLIGGTTGLARNVICGNGGNGGINLSNNGAGTAGSSGNRIQGNFIGTDITGTIALGNVNGIALGGGSLNNQIGGDDATDGTVDGVVRARNVISGNPNDGINIGNGNGQANGNIIQGNYIGVNVNGTAALPNNFNGISANGVNATQIGGTTAGAGNLISGNNQSGISLNEANPGSGTLPATNTHIEGNFIGTNAAGTAALRNLGSGVNISGTNSSNNYVGGSATGARNLIGASSSNAVSINVRADGNFVLGNWIGVDITGSTALVTSVSGANSFGNANGVVISGSSNNQIGGVTAAERNVIAGNAGQGVTIVNANSGSLVQSSGNKIQGNYIGLNTAGTDMVVDPTGGQKFGNRNAGLSISGATNNLIGGTTPGAGNVISGSFQQGILITNSNNVSGSGNTIQGNIIGSNVAMTTPLPNGFGIFLTNGALNNTIGGDDLADGTADGVASAGNKIFGSTNDGIQVTVTIVGTVIFVPSGNTIQGNLIGGSRLLRNGGNGINLNGTTNNLVGGTTAGAGNVISWNGNNGVVMNCTNFSGVIKCAVGNQIQQNSIFSNNNIGIRLNANGAGVGNNNQASPVISFVITTGANTSAQGSLVSVANSQFTLEFFANDSCDVNAGGAGEGQNYIGSAQVTTDGAGNATFNIATLNPVAVGKIITATATQTTNGTSRFSSCVIASSSTGTISGRTVDQNGGPLSGATVTLSGSQSATATTDAAGNYSFPNLPSNVSYTVSASLAGVTFYPASFTLANLPADRTVNFTKAIARYAITDLGALTPGPVSIGWDVNSAGQVTGWSSAVTSTNFKPFFYSNGTLTSLTPLGTGTNALAIAISDSGRVVGYSELTPQGPNGSFTGQVHGFFSDNAGVLKEIGALGGSNSQAWGVNDNGAVVGQAQDASLQARPFLWRDTNNDGVWQANEMINLGAIAGTTFGRGFSVSNNNIVVGNSTDGATGFVLATMWKDDNGNGIGDAGELRDLRNLGGSNANASGVNDNGYVCGTSETTGLASNGLPLQRGFIWHDDNGNGVSDPGEMKNLGTLGGEFSSVLRMNQSNEIIGWSDAVGINTARAIRYKNNFMLDLNSAIPQNSGWVLTEARGISDNGKITGYGTINGTQHAYVLTPSLVGQTVTFDPLANKTYGNAPFTVSATSSSNLPVTFSVMSGPATVSGNTVTITGAGTVTLRAYQGGDDTYDSAFADQAFNVAPVLLRVIAESKTKVYGAPNPTFTVHYSGFVNGDGSGSLGGALSFSTAADNSPVGSYSITPIGYTSNNYTLQYLAATLTIDQAGTSTASGNYNIAVPGNVNLVAQVTGDAPSTQTVNGGTVAFVIRQGATTVGTVTSGAVANGQANANFNVPAGGAYTVYASYSGTTNYLGSTGVASLTVGNANAVPSITGVTPDSAVKKPTETGQFTLFIDGNGFMSTANGNPANSTVDWFDRNSGVHTNLSLSSITAAQIQAVVPYTLIRDGKTVEITVSNPGPGGGPSNVQPFFVTDTTATVTSSETAITNPATGTASTTSVGTSGALLSAEASSGGAAGSGTLTVAQYSADPIGTNSSPNTSAFSTAEGSGYFDVYVAPGSSFTSLTLDYCNTGGTTLYWWDGSVWGLVSNQTYNPTTGCITVTVTTTSSPSIAQLTGTVFGVGSGPAINSISVTPSATVARGSGAITLNASFTDAGGSGPRTADITWGDGQVTNLTNVTGTTVTSTHTYSVVGSYAVTVKVSRGTSFGTSTFSPVVVFDPNTGSVKGSGWFNSPLGAYPSNPTFSDKVHFDFDVQYKKNETTPSGKGLSLTIPGLKFEGIQFGWLIISGPQAQFNGAGSVNGVSGFDFIVTGLDGKIQGKKIPDKLRIRIWNHSTGQVVYDSQLNGPVNAPPTVALGGGEVSIKK